MEKTSKVIKEIGNFDIVKYYADALYTTNNEPYYGNIYSSKEEAMAENPHSEILEGYGFLDKNTGYQPGDTPDWFDTVEDVVFYIKEQY